MKTLLLVRHSKSDWPEDIEDFDRPLTDLGIINATKMGNYLKERSVDIESFISSPAKRALHTCELFSKVFQRSYSTDATLYNPREANFENLIYGLDDSINSVALFSHNNGISNFANSLTDEIVNLPTSGVVGYEIDCDSWSDFEMAKKRFLFFYSPKNFNQ
ncbi:SixA phosphatase family protein [Epilithonimonas hungarica]|jgi:Phosphohistidine phosphatase SixA|uniref:Phosphohistidine phosphatase n=1 Tax=Epilithonimonas hungarica TaxID=454006 RepID=A0A1G7U841_9FLAO|nr:histidine phosphatase family protein [Epilithonimonas hungarica]MDP9955350.1 phosphohistidine phosphatase [Epilithonimonas hungarica]MPT31042.1 phosphohistidine phosphatase [Chryseobacterium sp.]SDG43732.1 phosphohistidine phosphatase [Epilithonimonas hungarica]